MSFQSQKEEVIGSTASFLRSALVKTATALIWASNHWRLVLGAIFCVFLLWIYWTVNLGEDTRAVTHTSERVVGDSIAFDSSAVWVTDLTPFLSGPTVQTTDSTGEQKSEYRIPTSRSSEDQKTETVRIENGEDGEATELLVRPPTETRLFPHFRSPQNYVTVLSGDGVSITRTHRSFLDLHFSPAIGAAITDDFTPYLSVGATALRVGPVFFGASLLVSEERLSVAGEASIDVATRLNLSVGITHRKAVNVGLRYRF